MCGIIGYIGNKNASKIVLAGLKNLDYRGYDSWGIAAYNNPGIDVVKDVGKIEDVQDLKLPASRIAIGHTRWATHGSVSKNNAHPHLSCDKRIAIVHNGIIENYNELKSELSHHKFASETDSEVICHLIEEYNKDNAFIDAVKKAARRLKGSYAVLILNKDSKELISIRKGSPLVLGLGNKEYYISSDAIAFLDNTRNIIYLDDNEMVVIDDKLKIFDLEKDKAITKNVEVIEWDVEQAQKGNFQHFMLKEIMEQKEVIERAINQDDIKLKYIAEKIKHSNQTYLVGSGTAANAAFTAVYLFSRIAGKHINFIVASEFPRLEQFLTDKALLITISQSGETADVLEAVKAAKNKGVEVLSLINVRGSSLMRASDHSFTINAGPEKSVASTKSYTAQLSLLTLLAYACNNHIADGKAMLHQVSKKINEILNPGFLDNISYVAEMIKDSENLYIIGRGLNYPTALESALKIKEVSYIHAEGFAGGELKHGVIALVEENTPCIVLTAEDDTIDDIISNAHELKSRGAFIIGVGPKNYPMFDVHIKVPDIGLCSPILNVIPMQLLAYYLAVKRNCNPDKPRNLAKSVTVK